MLILGRRENESISIGDDIKIKIVSIERGNVKIGFEAPKDVLILRDELRVAVENVNKKSTNDIDTEILKGLEGKLKIKKEMK
jgi:carbon storage regulator